MRKLFVILIHLGFWVCYFVLVSIVLWLYYRSSQHMANQESRLLNAFNSILLFAFVPSVISFYSYYFLLFPKYLQQKKYLLSILVGVLISISVAFFGYLVLRYFIESGRVIDMDRNGIAGRSTFFQVIFVMFLINLVCGVVGLVIKGFVTWFNEIKLKEALKEKTHEMEMSLIKSQLDPHLLFNTINNIDALILKDTVAASDYLNKLSDIMRFMLYETKTDYIPLSREIEYIEKYIALQKIRTANKAYVNFSITGKVNGMEIAPMTFIPFIENAFKHTNNKKLEDAITIAISVQPQKIHFTCENKFETKTSAQHSEGGLGNTLIQKRLNLIYADQHTLEVHKTEELYSVNLTIYNG